MKCPICNSEMTCKKSTYHYQESGLDNIYLSDVEIYNCACGEEFVSIPAGADLHTLIGLDIVKKNALLNGKEIRFLRKNMGLTAKKLSEYTGINNATISRWENGTQPISKPHDLYLRLLYLTNKGIPHDTIRHLIEDNFPNVKPEAKNTIKHTISIQSMPQTENCQIAS
ncbi:MAG: helix-turn-helix domain-containing protein [Deltaproteobacteria bacterium]|nr:helix-turn-helix domain-containing protein [Deltaproteobacteria bacterium]MBW2099329.1 helix-turn-helix domain-containing protein [Deltaproteobacteria bacterium]